MQAALRHLGLPLALALTGCTPVVVPEASAQACVNGVDDDGNGEVDCNDSNCALLAVCEATATACRNGFDDNRNGQVDCEDASCIGAGRCEPFAGDCDAYANTGCPRGMACVLSEASATDTRTGCRLPDVGQIGATCDYAEGRGCFSGLLCIRGLCVRPCETDWECYRNSSCERPATHDFGFCSIPCLPNVVCPNGATCASVAADGSPFDASGHLWACPLLDVRYVGTAAQGALCDNPPTDASASEAICTATLSCVPDADGHAHCRSVCATNAELGTTMLACDEGQTCSPVDPFDPRPPLNAAYAQMGVCLDP